MGLASQLSNAGVDLGQMQTIGTELLNHARAQVGPEQVNQIAAAVPGLSKFL